MIINENNFDTDRWPNFSVDELKCKCGCNKLLFSTHLLDALQHYRNDYGAVKITSAYRCPQHNASVSSTGHDGPHTTGFAVDISTNTKSQYDLVRFFLANYSAKGIGIAKSFTHIDYLTAAQGDKYEVRPNMWSY